MHVRVHIYVDNRKEVIKEIGENNFEIKLKVPAEHNLANNRMREILARWYNTEVGKVRIITGHHSPRKVVDVLLD